MNTITRNTKQGVAQGILDYDSKIETYLGIPYAKAPVGERRWKAPAELEPWTEVLDATKPYPIPFQKEGYFINDQFDKLPQSEDVLYVNIWTNGDGKRKPVYVWFHGGAFQGGYAYDPTFQGCSFAKKNIVFVSVEYRCGVFGFLAHEELSKESAENVSGNYGYQDNLAALRWIRKNIADYDGNPDQITIGGQSAGGNIVHTLMCMKQAKGLFHQAIIESGIIKESKKYLKTAEQAGGRLMSMFGCDSISELRNIDGKVLLERSFDLEKDTLAQGVFPCVDDVYIHDDCDSYEADMPLLIGNNSKEGIMFFGKMTKEEYCRYLNLQYEKQSEAILEAYPAETDEESLQQCVDIESNTWITQTEKYVEKRERDKKSPTYFYFFSHCSHDKEGKLLEANHSGELWYAFDSLESAYWDVSDEDKALANVMNAYWANFIKTGNPSGEGLQRWEAFQESNPVRMCFDKEVTLEKKPYNRELWNLLYGKEE